MKSDIMKRLNSFLPVIIFGLIMAGITIASGCRGIYLFDGSIPLLFGHLLQNGRHCFNEIIMPPLGPLSGYLSAAGYILFGKCYLSQVIMAGIICGIASSIVLLFLKRRLQTIPAILCSFLIILSTVPIPGILFYNDFALLLFAVLFIFGFERCCDPDHPAWLEYAMWTMVGLQFLNKPNFGVVAGIGSLALEIVLFYSVKKISLKKKTVDFLILLASGLIFLYTARFNFSAIISSVFNTIPPPSKFYFLFNNGWIFLKIYNSFLLSGFLLFLLLLYSFYFRSYRTGYLLSLWCGIFWILLFSNSFLSCYVWPAQFFIIGAIAAAGMVQKFDEKKEKFKLLIIGLVLFYSIVLISIIRAGGFNLKKWNELKGDFSADLKNIAKVEEGFFRGVKVQKHQLLMANIINAVSQKMPDKKIFFGPELGMFYPATDRLPPVPWFLWEDKRLLRTGIKNVIDQLKSENYDIMILPLKPQEPPEYSNYLSDIHPLTFTLSKAGLVFRFKHAEDMFATEKIINSVL